MAPGEKSSQVTHPGGRINSDLDLLCSSDSWVSTTKTSAAGWRISSSRWTC